MDETINVTSTTNVGVGGDRVIPILFFSPLHIHVYLDSVAHAKSVFWFV